MDHRNIQDLGKRPFTTILQSPHHQRAKTKGVRSPSLPLRSRSNSSTSSYSRSQDRDDLSSVATSIDRRTPRSLFHRRSGSGRSTHTRRDSHDTSHPKAWMAKGSRFLKRQNRERGKRLFAPEHGGSYEAFRVRPLSQEMIDYCVVDVAYMPNLYEKYNLMLENIFSLVSEDH